MIKKYIEFINEGQFNGFNSLGEWVESLIDDSYIQNIITRYTKGSDPSINLSNAINVLDDKEQQEIKAQIDHYLENGIEKKVFFKAKFNNYLTSNSDCCSRYPRQSWNTS